MSNFFRSIIRASSFFRKEIFEILRQPRLVATLVLGPFLILFIFGIGFRSQARTLRTLFVNPPNGPITTPEIQQYAKTIGSALILTGVTADQKEALAQLQQGKVDLVVVMPGDINGALQNNEQSIFTLYHREIDPAQVNYINYVGWLYVGAVNQQVLYSLAVQGQKDSLGLQTNLQEAHQNALAMRQALQSGDETLAKQKQQGLAGNVGAVSQAVGASLGLLDSLQSNNGSNGESADPAQATLTDLRQNSNQLGEGAGTRDERLAALEKIDKDLVDLQGKLAVFQSLDPLLIVSPFRSDVKSVAPVQPTNSDFFAPAVLALLLQHLAVTFAALSIVRERNVGTMELFRVSPLSAAEGLFGKYMSYMLFGAMIAAILSALLVFTLHMPMLGNWWNFTLVISGILFTSLGIGFAISIVSQTDSQAVQYSMIVLLASVFFSGFIMSLDMLSEPVRIISWLLPTTYGTILLRDIALRGSIPDWTMLGGLFAFGLVLMLISWRLMHRLIVSPR
jgi:ABC-2 type transport system permease protein